MTFDRSAFSDWGPRQVARLIGLGEAERRYYIDILDALPVGVAVLGQGRVILSVNQQFLTILDLEKNGLENLTLDRVIKNCPGAPHLIRACEKALDSLEPHQTKKLDYLEPPLPPGENELQWTAETRYTFTRQSRTLQATIQPISGWEWNDKAELLLTIWTTEVQDLR